MSPACLRREQTIDEAGDALIDMIRRTANGRNTAAEALGPPGVLDDQALPVGLMATDRADQHRRGPRPVGGRIGGLWASAAANARSVAHALVAAEAEGQVGHGFSRLTDYAAQAQSGKVDGQAVPVRTTSRRPDRSPVDAANGFAYPALWISVSHAASRRPARRVRWRSRSTARIIAARSRCRSAVWPRRGLLGLMVANAHRRPLRPGAATQASLAPTRLPSPRPETGQPPLVIDLSLSRVARGKVMHAKKSGLSIPEGWALDAQGQPTTDPEGGAGRHHAAHRRGQGNSPGPDGRNPRGQLSPEPMPAPMCRAFSPPTARPAAPANSCWR